MQAPVKNDPSSPTMTLSSKLYRLTKYKHENSVTYSSIKIICLKNAIEINVESKRCVHKNPRRGD